MMKKTFFAVFLLIAIGLLTLTGQQAARAARNMDYHVDVPFLYEDPPPLVLLVMGRDHKLYYEAYNDASDINEDGSLDINYRGEVEPLTHDADSDGEYDPDDGDTFNDVNGDGKRNSGFDYYGYFDSYKCYEYNDTLSPPRFEPSHETTDKKCDNDSDDDGILDNAYWSGDFLNYLTTTRMDALRKVLYGGYRSLDPDGTTGEPTLLERVFIPQDTHVSGHEYTSIDHDGYDIREYAPLDLPALAGDTTLRHLFASVTLDENNDNDVSSDPPLLRIAPHNPKRIWDWIAAERPVARNSLVEYDGNLLDGTWNDSINSHEEWEQVIADFANADHLQTGGTCNSTEPSRYVDIVRLASAENLNPCMDATNYDYDPYEDQYYISTFKGTFTVYEDTAWTKNDSTTWRQFTNVFKFKIASDDRLEVIISPNSSSAAITPITTTFDASDDVYIIPGTSEWVFGTKAYISNGRSAEVELANGTYNITIRYHEQQGEERWFFQYDRQFNTSSSSTGSPLKDTGLYPANMKDLQYYDPADIYKTKAEDPANYQWASRLVALDDSQGWQQSFYDLVEFEPTESKIFDRAVRVEVCNASMPEDNCKEYPKGIYKPTGLLHKYGESDKMYFGLLTGSYHKNTEGGVLRKNISSFSNEVDKDTGQLIHKDPDSGQEIDTIFDTINKMRIVGFAYEGFTEDRKNYAYVDSQCDRFTHEPENPDECEDWGNPVAEMMYEGLRYFAGKGAGLSEFLKTPSSEAPGLPIADWVDPYDTHDGFESCSQPYMIVISDINPSWDSDWLPGSAFDTTISDDIGMNVTDLATIIFGKESDLQDDHFIGQSGTTEDDNACSSKTIDQTGAIRGICPEVPAQEGSYYSAAVAYYGLKYDISATADGNQNVTTMTVALASPLPEINISMDEGNITLVPFCKSYWAKNNGYIDENSAIVDFFVEELTNDSGKFRINYMDAPYGADNDADLLVFYKYEVIKNTVTGKDELQVTVEADSDSISTGVLMHAGYMISGTTHAGAYLEIRGPEWDGDDVDTLPNDRTYDLDTPEGCWADSEPSCNDETLLPHSHTRTFSPSSTPAVTLMKNPLFYAAKWGGFTDSNTPTEDTNHNGLLDDGEDTNSNTAIDYIEDENTKFSPDLQTEWDTDANGVPDNYFYVINPAKLEAELDKAFSVIQSSTTSGTATAVISNSSDGDGAAYQTTFYPRYEDINGTSIYWAGQLNAFLIDSHGNFREDTDGDGQLDIHLESDTNGDSVLDPAEDLNGDGDLDDSRDRIIVYTSDGSIYRYDDENENSEVDDGEPYDVISDPININYLWTATDWLNDDTLDPVTQRSYSSTEKKRYIITFIDKDGDGIVDHDANEQIDFSSATDSTTITPTDATTVYPYLTQYPSFTTDKTTLASWAVAISDQTTLLQKQSQRQINFIRGEEQDAIDIDGTTVPAMRSRTYYDSKHFETRVWRLGDTVASSPTMVARPAEMYHLLYNDNTYTDFYVRYRKRRSVIYMGGNDGMLHAFNAGFYDSGTSQFKESINEPYYDENENGSWDSGERLLDWDGNGIQNTTTAYTLGQELWAYVPYNLLPHLYWLTELDYQHVSYVDLKPKIFDVKVFFDNSTETSWDDDHPNGWGTIMVVGMNMGGGKIVADMDKNDTNDTLDGYDKSTDKDRIMSSAYIIMDITNPEKEPKVLAEINVEGLGYTTCSPAVVTMKNDGTDTSGLPVSDPNDWYLVFGSGPADSNGEPATGTVLEEAISKQNGKLFILDLKELVKNKNVSVPKTITLTTTKTYVSAPMTADFDLSTFSPDAVYFGTVSGKESEGWGGELGRLVIQDDINPTNWFYSKLIDLTGAALGGTGRPVVVSPNGGMGGYVKTYETDGTVTLGFKNDPTARNRWIFFGTGRYYQTVDANNNDQQGFYGIKETFDYEGGWNWVTVDKSELLNTTGVEVYKDKTVDFADSTNPSTITTWDELIEQVDKKQGWWFDFTNQREKNINRCLIFGELVYFTNYEPSLAECSLEGNGWLYAVYYKTGTAYYDYTLDYNWDDTDHDGIEDPDEVQLESRVSTGGGVPSAPSLITTDTGETDVVVQRDDGTSISFETSNPGMTRSGKAGWIQRK